MRDNLLQLNKDKTDLQIIISRNSVNKSLDTAIKVGDQSIKLCDVPSKNLGVIFDTIWCLKHHVSNVCKSIIHQLYSIGKIRKHLDLLSIKKIVNATTRSRLDYCDSKKVSYWPTAKMTKPCSSYSIPSAKVRAYYTTPEKSPLVTSETEDQVSNLATDIQMHLQVSSRISRWHICLDLSSYLSLCKQ